MAKHAVTIKIYYDTKQCKEKDIVTEIESWDDIEDVVVLGSVQVD